MIVSAAPAPASVMLPARQRLVVFWTRSLPNWLVRKKQVLGSVSTYVPAGTWMVLASEAGRPLAARIAPRRLQSSGTAGSQVVSMWSSAVVSTVNVAA